MEKNWWSEIFYIFHFDSFESDKGATNERIPVLTLFSFYAYNRTICQLQFSVCFLHLKYRTHHPSTSTSSIDRPKNMICGPRRDISQIFRGENGGKKRVLLINSNKSLRFLRLALISVKLSWKISDTSNTQPISRTCWRLPAQHLLHLLAFLG